MDETREKEKQRREEEKKRKKLEKRVKRETRKKKKERRRNTAKRKKKESKRECTIKGVEKSYVELRFNACLIFLARCRNLATAQKSSNKRTRIVAWTHENVGMPVRTLPFTRQSI